MTPHALARELNQMSDRAAIQFIRDRLADMAVDISRLEAATNHPARGDEPRRSGTGAPSRSSSATRGSAMGHK